MQELFFKGEESARFSRFACIALEFNMDLSAEVLGRDPLTGRIVNIQGKVTNAVCDGYMRNIKVVDAEAINTMTYWVAGTNATRSIAAIEVKYTLSQEDYEKLKFKCNSDCVFIPGLIGQETKFNENWKIVDRASKEITEENLQTLLRIINLPDADLVREAALDIRAYADLVASSRSLQASTVKSVHEAMNKTTDTDALIALTEAIGYVGSESSLPLLIDFLKNENVDIQINWAAVISLGRLSDDSVIYALVERAENHVFDRDIDGYNVDTTSLEEWTEAAILLCLSRRASNINRGLLEKVFLKRLKSKSDLLKRYACLGLSRFKLLESKTIEELIGLLGDVLMPISIRGYAALALLSVIETCDEAVQDSIKNILASVVNITAEMVNEPEAIWSLESLAELCSLLDLYSEAAKYHNELSEFFESWRTQYYKALSMYEKGNALVLQGDIEEAIQLFSDGIQALESIRDTVGEHEKATIVFRIDIIRARMISQSAIYAWVNTVSPPNLLKLEIQLAEAINIYKIYANRQIGVSPEVHRIISERESNYIKGIGLFLEVLKLIINFDYSIRQDPANVNAMSSIEQIGEALDIVDPLVKHSKATVNLISKIKGKFKECISSQAHDTKQTLRKVLSEIRGLVLKSAWPMPARACPIGGLGKGTLTIQRDGLKGIGTYEDPYLFSPHNPVLFNIVVNISETAPTVDPKCYIFAIVAGSETHKNNVIIFDGPAMMSVLLTNPLSNQTPTLIRFVLRFETRDCFQDSAHIEVFAKKTMEGNV